VDFELKHEVENETKTRVEAPRFPLDTLGVSSVIISRRFGKRFAEQGNVMAIQLKPLDQQAIVLTGATSGIGLVTARDLAKAGAKLVLVARNEDALREITGELTQMGAEVVYAAADVADRSKLAEAAQLALTRFGRIDTWINDAGVGMWGRLQDGADEDHRRLFETNFWGVVYGSLLALPHLKQHGGALINVGSEVSEAVVPLQGMYATTKHAVKGFTDALRVELEVEEAPVSVSLIQPTAVDTPFPQHARNITDQEPKLPSPMIEAQQVAGAILHSCTNADRDVKVGVMSVLNTTIHNLIPKLGDKMSTAQQDRQHYDEAPRDPAGSLHSPAADGDGHIKGSGGVQEK